MSNVVSKENREFAFIQYMQCTPPLDEIDLTLNCICLRWATVDEVDRTVETELSHSKVSSMEEGEWYGMEPFESIFGSVHVVRSNLGIPPFTEGLPWPKHRFYINSFFPYSQ